jgi:hypothetical protein
MQFIHLTTAFFFLLALTHAAPASNPVADLRFICEILLDKCPTAFLKVLKALENLPVNSSITTTPSYTSPPIIISALAIETSLIGTPKI